MIISLYERRFSLFPTLISPPYADQRSAGNDGDDKENDKK